MREFESVQEFEVNVLPDKSTCETALPECESKVKFRCITPLIVVALKLQKNMMPQMDDRAHFFKQASPPSRKQQPSIHPGTVKISVGLGEWHAVPLVHYATLARSLGRE